MASVFISKIVIVYFWGYIGGTLIESFTDIEKVGRVIALLLFAYLVSLITRKKIDLR